MCTITVIAQNTGTKACANSVDPDQISQNTASDLGLNCLPLIQPFLDTSIGSKMNVLEF